MSLRNTPYLLLGIALFGALLGGCRRPRPAVTADPDAPLQRSLAENFTPPFEVGDPAPDFTLPDGKGKPHRLSEMVHGDTLLTFTCVCAQCLHIQQMMAGLQAAMGARAPEMLTVTRMPYQREKSWYRDTGLKQTFLYAPKHDKEVIPLYKGHPCPRIYRLSADRRVTFIGASPGTNPGQEPRLLEVAMQAAQDLGFDRQTAMQVGGGVIRSRTPKGQRMPPFLRIGAGPSKGS